MDINIVLGTFLLIIATVSIVIAFLIAIQQYLFPKKSTRQQLVSTKVLELFLQLLSDILKAPPALAFLVSGLLIGAAGIWILVTKPI